PLRLRVYILCHLLALAPLLITVFQCRQIDQWWLVGALLLFTVIFSTWKVELTIFQGKMTPTFGIVCLALLLQGLEAALLCAAPGAFIGSVGRPARARWGIRLFWPPFYRIGCNLANCVVACFAAALVFDTVVRCAPGPSLSVVLGLTAFTATYFA